MEGNEEKRWKGKREETKDQKNGKGKHFISYPFLFGSKRKYQDETISLPSTLWQFQYQNLSRFGFEQSALSFANIPLLSFSDLLEIHIKLQPLSVYDLNIYKIVQKIVKVLRVQYGGHKNNQEIAWAEPGRKKMRNTRRRWEQIVMQSYRHKQ